MDDNDLKKTIEDGFKMLHACLSEFDHPVNELMEHVVALRADVEDKSVDEIFSAHDRFHTLKLDVRKKETMILYLLQGFMVANECEEVLDLQEELEDLARLIACV